MRETIAEASYGEAPCQPFLTKRQVMCFNQSETDHLTARSLSQNRSQRFHSNPEPRQTSSKTLFFAPRCLSFRRTSGSYFSLRFHQ